MDSHKIRLSVEELGDRIVPAVFRTAFPHSVVGQVVTFRQNSPRDLNTGPKASSLTGTYSTTEANGLTTYEFSGLAHVSGRGRFNVSGSITEAGPGKHARAGGHLVLSNAKGSIIIHLRGPDQKGDRPLPSQYTFRIVGGTGAYHALKDNGPARVVLTPSTGEEGSENSFVIRLS